MLKGDAVVISDIENLDRDQSYILKSLINRKAKKPLKSGAGGLNSEAETDASAVSGQELLRQV